MRSLFIREITVKYEKPLPKGRGLGAGLAEAGEVDTVGGKLDIAQVRIAVERLNHYIGSIRLIECVGIAAGTQCRWITVDIYLFAAGAVIDAAAARSLRHSQRGSLERGGLYFSCLPL